MHESRPSQKIGVFGIKCEDQTHGRRCPYARPIEWKGAVLQVGVLTTASSKKASHKTEKAKERNPIQWLPNDQAFAVITSCGKKDSSWMHNI
jgi:hypothetical protein